MTLGGADLRRVAGRFATGVTVVAATCDGVPGGLTVNSFASVSLDPPLVLVCISRAARAYRCVDGAGGFAASILAEDQEDVARLFASLDEDKFAKVGHHPSPRGHPLIAGACAWLDCEVVARHAGGTHTIFVARVTGLGAADGRPLLFHGGRYARLGE